MLRFVLSRLVPYTSRIGTTLLRHPVSRRLLNAAYERLGPACGTVVTRLMSDSRVPLSFVWRCRFADADILVPVIPSLQRSWSNALFWRWPPALPMRTVYEWYLQNKRPPLKGTPGSRPALLDVGANDGMHTYPFAANGWTCVSFEPQSDCVEYVRRVRQLGGFDDVEVVQSVVADEDSEAVEFYVSESSWFSSLTREQVEHFEPASQVRVGAVTLDRYCDRHSVQPTCLKIDVEGAELRVLRGARQVLESCTPDLFIEVTSDPQNKREIWELLERLGYGVYALTSDRRQPLRRVPDLPSFVAAGEQHRHVDILAVTDPRLIEGLESRFAPV